MSDLHPTSSNIQWEQSFSNNSTTSPYFPRDDNQLLPNVFINAPVRGVKLVQQHHVNFVLQVPAALAVIPGVMTALLISVASVALLENIWLVAIVSLFAGLTALVAGAVVYRVCRRLWNLLFG